MKKLLASFAIVLLPLAASAQAPPQMQRVPAPLPFPSAAGITVNGFGSVRVPVKTVQVTAQARGVADEASVLAAMRAAGVEDPVAGVAGARLYPGNQTMLRGTIRDATRAKLDRLGEAAARYVASHPGSSVDNVAFTPHLDDCAAAEQTARAAAMADARRKADALAALSGGTVDAVAAVTESGGCPAPQEPGNFAGGSGSFDIGTLTDTVFVSERVTFAFSPGSASTRRRPL